MVKKTLSASGSMKGWSFKTLLYKNKDNIKALILLLAGWNYFQGFSWEAFIIAVLALVAKLLVDTFDFWVSEVEL